MSLSDIAKKIERLIALRDSGEINNDGLLLELDRLQLDIEIADRRTKE